jgi:hypothetical protein
MNMNLQMDTDTAENMGMDTDVDADMDCRLCPVNAYWFVLVHVHVQLVYEFCHSFQPKTINKYFLRCQQIPFNAEVAVRICKELLIVRDFLLEKSTVNIQSYCRCQRTTFSAYYTSSWIKSITRRCGCNSNVNLRRKYKLRWGKLD